MSQIRERIQELNPDLFNNRQPSKEHEVVLVGEKVTKDGTTTYVYLHKSKPSEAAKKAGIKVAEFLHATFKPKGSIKTNDDGSRSFSGPKKARTSNVFQNTQPDLYTFLKEGLDLGEDKGWVKGGFDALKRPTIKMKDTVFGLKITINTDLYKPHNLHKESGLMKPLQAATYDPKTGKYNKQDVVIGTYTFFADDDDLDNLLEVCARHYQKHVAPYITETVVKTTKKGSTVKTEVRESEVTGTDDPIFDNDGNQIDENGEIIKTKEQLEEEAQNE